MHKMSQKKVRKVYKPNILVTGTPGVGKTRFAKELAEMFQFKRHDVSQIATENNFLEGYDERLDCPVLDEDKLLDFLEPMMKEGGNIVEYHGCDFFPQRWFDAVFVLTCNNTVLYDRLEQRNYSATKIRSNVECEIFQTIYTEACDSYDEEIIFSLKSETEEDLEKNIQTAKTWHEQWSKDNSLG